MENKTVKSEDIFFMCRSFLFVPGNKEKYFFKANNSNTDVIIFDFEDSIPKTEKNQARTTVKSFLISEEHFGERKKNIAIRINSIESLYFEDDFSWVLENSELIDILIIPKIDTRLELEPIVTEAKNKNIKTIAMIESKFGFVNLKEIASCPNLFGLMFGDADFSADLEIDNNFDILNLYKRDFILYGKINKLLLIDSPFFDVRNIEGLKNNLSFIKKFGFESKAVIHPDHIDDVNKNFSYSQDEIEWAKKIVEENKKGSGLIDGQMVDEAIARKAKKILKSIK